MKSKELEEIAKKELIEDDIAKKKELLKERLREIRESTAEAFIFLNPFLLRYLLSVHLAKICDIADKAKADAGIVIKPSDRT